MECLNCHTEYTGNYCPNCGQPSSTKRFTVKNALMSTLEVWGMGNRSLPRTLYHLFTRPGQMIGEYLDGKRIPFFPPVKMLFVLCIFITVETMIIGRETIKDEVMKMSLKDNNATPEELKSKADHTLININGKVVTIEDGLDILRNAVKWFDEHKAIELICLHSFFMFFSWFLFRKSPLRPRSTLAENFYAQVLISCQMVAMSIIYLPFSGNETYTFYPLPSWILFALLVWDFKYLFGFNWRKTIRVTIILHLLCSLAFIIILSLTIGIIGFATGIFSKLS